MKKVFGILLVSLSFILMGCDNNSFKVSFDSNGGSNIDSITLKCGEILSFKNIPVREGYRFMSWIDKNYNPIYDGALLTCEDIVLTANWEKLGSITFDSKGGSMVNKIYFSEGDVIDNFETPVREGYNFVGWYTKDDVWFGNGIKLSAEDIILYAKWDKK